MKQMRMFPALALILPLLLWGNPPANSQSHKEMTIRTESRTPRQGWLGVQIQDLTQKQAKELQVSPEEGALVTDVTADSPAEKGGIKKNDVIVDFNGRAIYDSEDLLKAVRRTKPGTAATVVVERKDGKKNLQLTVGKLKRDSWAMAPGTPLTPAIPRFKMFRNSQTCGLQLSELNSQLGEYFGAPDGEGVLVEEVEKESAGAKAGFKAGDVILRIGDEKVGDPSDVTDALEDIKDGEKASVEILRKGSRQTLSLTVEADDISRATPLPHHEGERVPREYLEQMHRSLDKLRENGTLQKELQEELGKIREAYGPEFQKQMRELKRQLEDIGRRVRVEIEQRRPRNAFGGHTV